MSAVVHWRALTKQAPQESFKLNTRDSSHSTVSRHYFIWYRGFCILGGRGERGVVVACLHCAAWIRCPEIHLFHWGLWRLMLIQRLGISWRFSFNSLFRVTKLRAAKSFIETSCNLWPKARSFCLQVLEARWFTTLLFVVGTTLQVLNSGTSTC